MAQTEEKNQHIVQDATLQKFKQQIYGVKAAEYFEKDTFCHTYFIMGHCSELEHINLHQNTFDMMLFHKNYDMAELYCKYLLYYYQHISKDVNNLIPTVYVKLVTLYVTRNNIQALELAVSYLTKAIIIQSPPHRPIAKQAFKIAKLYDIKYNKWNKSKIWFQNAIKFDSTDSYFYYAYGLSCTQHNEFDLAVTNLKMGVTLKGNNTRYLNEYARALYKAKDYSTCLEVLETNIKLNHNDGAIQHSIYIKNKLQHMNINDINANTNINNYNINNYNIISTDEKNNDPITTSLTLDVDSKESKESSTITTSVVDENVLIDEFDRWWYDVIIVDRFKTPYYIKLRDAGLNVITKLPYLYENDSVLKNEVGMNIIHQKVFMKVLTGYMRQHREFIQFMDGLPLLNKTSGHYYSLMENKRGITTMDGLWYHARTYEDLCNIIGTSGEDARTIWEWANLRT